MDNQIHNQIVNFSIFEQNKCCGEGEIDIEIMFKALAKLDISALIKNILMFPYMYDIAILSPIVFC